MKSKKIVAVILLAIILISQFTFIRLNNKVYAAEVRQSSNVSEKYFYNQLTEDAKIFYNAMDEMFHKNDYAELKKELEKPDSKFSWSNKKI